MTYDDAMLTSCEAAADRQGARITVRQTHDGAGHFYHVRWTPLSAVHGTAATREAAIRRLAVILGDVSL